MDFVMLFDRQYQGEGLVCLTSILQHDTGAKVYVLCLESGVAAALQNMARVIPIALEEVEYKHPDLLGVKGTRPWAPYTQTIKPFLLRYVFETFSPETLTYVDSDMLFWGACSELEQALGEDSFMVAPYDKDHDSPPSYFNAGCVVCRNDEACHVFLAWWQERCIEWCLWEDGGNGLFADEGYLTVIHTNPTQFEGTKACQHPGINLAMWNVKKHEVAKIDDVVMVDQTFPLVCYHYQGFHKTSADYQAPVDVPEATADLLYRPYHDLLPVWAPVPVGSQHDAEFPSSVPEGLLDFPETDGSIQLQATALECVSAELLAGARADEILGPALRGVVSRAPAVVIKFCGQIVGFFVPRGMSGSYEMPIYIDPNWRNKGIGSRVVKMYMTDKRGQVAIWVRNVMAKRAYAAAGFVRQGNQITIVNGREAETWVKEKD